MSDRRPSKERLEGDELLATTLKAYQRPLAERYFGKVAADNMTVGELRQFIHDYAMDKRADRSSVNGNHVPMLSEDDGRPEMNQLPFTYTAVQDYLDRAITSWRFRRDEAENTYQRLQAECYVDAFQSMRSSLFGETLPRGKRLETDDG